MARNLSTKQRRMAELMAEGHTAIFAYEQAGYSGDPHRKTCQIVGNSGFKRYLAELQAESRTGAIMTRTKRLERLSGIAGGEAWRHTLRMDESHRGDEQDGGALCIREGGERSRR